MATWPTVADVKRRLGIDTANESVDSDVESALLAAIEIVTADATYQPLDGESEPVLTFELPPDLPNRVREAALLLTVAGYKAPDAPHGVAGIFDTAAIYVAREHPHYGVLMRGYRAQTGIA